MRQYISLIVFTAIVNALCATAFSQEIKMYSLLERLRLSTAVVEGTVEQIVGDTVRVAVRRVVKGSVRSPAIRVKWYRDLILGEPPLSYRPQEQVLLFLGAQQGGVYDTIGRLQGKLELQPSLAMQYHVVIQKILDFDASLSPELKKSVLIDMLEMQNQFAQLSALEIIYLEFHTNAFSTTPLIQPVLKLAQGADKRVAINATQVLSRIGDKSIFPVLIQLLSSPDSHVAETAFRVLKGMTRAEIEFESRQPAEARAKAIQKWQDWWEQNKDKVILVK